jgi:flagellar protein FliO/FliZ
MVKAALTTTAARLRQSRLESQFSPAPKSFAMSFADILRMMAALAVTLGLGGLALVVTRRFAPLEVLRARPQGERRLAVVESLMLDPQRRLVLVRCDGREHLLLLGEGRLVTDLGAGSAGHGKGSAA